MNALLKDLMSFYAKLDHFMKDTDRDCGICGECCQKLYHLRVYPIEIENIRRYTADDLALEKFQKFANGTIVKIWGDISGQCPFQEGALCVIYPLRPYHCRVYGHYDYRGRSLLEGCVYQGYARAYYHREELPLINELDYLVETYGTKTTCLSAGNALV